MNGMAERQREDSFRLKNALKIGRQYITDDIARILQKHPKALSQTGVFHGTDSDCFVIFVTLNKGRTDKPENSRSIVWQRIWLPCFRKRVIQNAIHLLRQGNSAAAAQKRPRHSVSVCFIPSRLWWSQACLLWWECKRRWKNFCGRNRKTDHPDDKDQTGRLQEKRNCTMARAVCGNRSWWDFMADCKSHKAMAGIHGSGADRPEEFTPSFTELWQIVWQRRNIL